MDDAHKSAWPHMPYIVAPSIGHREASRRRRHFTLMLTASVEFADASLMMLATRWRSRSFSHMYRSPAQAARLVHQFVDYRQRRGIYNHRRVLGFRSQKALIVSIF